MSDSGMPHLFRLLGAFVAVAVGIGLVGTGLVGIGLVDRFDA